MGQQAELALVGPNEPIGEAVLGDLVPRERSDRGARRYVHALGRGAADLPGDSPTRGRR